VGEIFRDIRIQLHEKKEKQLEKTLAKQLGDNDQQKYWYLVEKHPRIRDALDDLKDMVCLWPDMILSTFHKAFAVKRDQV
jgi:flagellar biosynthesis protein FliP